MRELEGKIAIVTGASRGIGEATAERLASAGAIVIAAARTVGDETDPQIDTLAYTVAQIRSRGGEAYAYALDLSKPESRAAFMDAVLERFGRVDLLVNNAGIAGLGTKSWEMLDKHFRRVFEIDVFAPRDLMIRALPGMLERGYGRIVNVSSTVADRAAPNIDGPPFLDFHTVGGVSAYCSAKSALNLFTRAFAAEVHGKGVSANIVSPVNSVMTRGTKELVAKGVVNMDRIQSPEDPETMAEAILALLVADPETINGRTTYSGQFLAEVGREVRGRDGGPFDAKVTVASVAY
ncbi:MAG: SDR family oxidoreductase [Sphingomonadales bacterium]|nr:MAG: SDR family oxidoreductase [Sphingomonadales bacterium]